MIGAVVNFALRNRFLVLGVAALLFLWGAISFHNLPVDAYPDIANNYVNIITQWPGRSAEDIEQQITVPTEIQMAGIQDLTSLRSQSLAGISSIVMNFSDGSDNAWNRERVLERLSEVTLPFIGAVTVNRRADGLCSGATPSIFKRAWVRAYSAAACARSLLD